MVSILLLTFDRYELMTRCVAQSLERAGYPFELLWCDNGSRDPRVLAYAAGLGPVYARRNRENEGVPGALNQLLLRARGQYLCTLDDDLLLPQNWLNELVVCHGALSRPGVGGVWWPGSAAAGVTTQVNGAKMAYASEINGVKFFNRNLLDTVGYFSEFSLYGLDDTDLSLRSRMTGLQNYYIQTSCTHEGAEDPRCVTPYRAFKSEHLNVARYGFSRQAKRYARTGNYYVAPPPLLRGDSETDEEWQHWQNFRYLAPAPVRETWPERLQRSCSRFRLRLPF